MSRSMVKSLFIVLFISLCSPTAHAKEEDLRRLMAEASDFQAEYRKAARTQAQIEAAEQDLSGSRLALKNAADALQSGREEAANRPSPCPQEAANPGAIFSCNAEAAKMEGWRGELLGQPGGREKYADRLQSEKERLGQAAARWADKKKSNLALLDVLDIAFQSWQRRYTTSAFKSAPYNRLVSSEEGAANCPPLPSAGREAILEAAQRCLQWLWIGEMQNRPADKK